jgi:hypothetical protein
VVVYPVYKKSFSIIISIVLSRDFQLQHFEIKPAAISHETAACS